MNVGWASAVSSAERLKHETVRLSSRPKPNARMVYATANPSYK